MREDVEAKSLVVQVVQFIGFPNGLAIGILEGLTVGVFDTVVIDRHGYTHKGIAEANAVLDEGARAILEVELLGGQTGFAVGRMEVFKVVIG